VSPNASLETIAGWLHAASRVVALTGAGISTESGIPDFRGPDGVWTKNPGAEKLSTLQHYMADREVRIQAWRARLESSAWTAEPNVGHLALADLERKGRLHTLVTQNIDGLHQKAGSSPSIIIEIHGTAHEFVCMNCSERGPMELALARVRAGEQDPPCRTCGGILKSATISFGQNLVPEDMEKSELASSTCDFFLAVGTSLTVYPVAYLPEIALNAGARLVIINSQATPYDDRADAVIREKIGQVLPALVASV
jgi:NAD-dependent deacetylase